MIYFWVEPLGLDSSNGSLVNLADLAQKADSFIRGPLGLSSENRFNSGHDGLGLDNGYNGGLSGSAQVTDSLLEHFRYAQIKDSV
jgi:hypothetical protein